MPPKMKKRGRPKGADKTVIGLPKKKSCSSRPVSFLKKLPIERVKGLLHFTILKVTTHDILQLCCRGLLIYLLLRELVKAKVLSKKMKLKVDQRG